MTKVLLLDDGRGHFDGVQRSITDTYPNCEVLIARTIEEASELVRANVIDVVCGLLDFDGNPKGGVIIGTTANRIRGATALIVDTKQTDASPEVISATLRATLPGIVRIRMARNVGGAIN